MSNIKLLLLLIGLTGVFVNPVMANGGSTSALPNGTIDKMTQSPSGDQKQQDSSSTENNSK